jgi:hypothetical protein
MIVWSQSQSLLITIKIIKFQYFFVSSNSVFAYYGRCLMASRKASTPLPAGVSHSLVAWVEPNGTQYMILVG